MVTEEFRDLVKCVNENLTVAICGPKGVGKSLALAAIATLCHKQKSPCFLFSPCVTEGLRFDKYINSIYGEFGKCNVLFFFLRLTDIPSRKKLI